MAGSSFSFGTLGLISTGVSTLFNAFGAKSVTKYNNAIAQAQADIAKINADTMNLHYQQRLFAAEGEYQRETMQAAQMKARQKVSLAANGVAIGVGSAAEQLASTDIVKKINLNRLESNAKSEEGSQQRYLRLPCHSGQARAVGRSKGTGGISGVHRGRCHRKTAKILSGCCAAYGR